MLHSVAIRCIGLGGPFMDCCGCSGASVLLSYTDAQRFTIMPPSTRKLVFLSDVLRLSKEDVTHVNCREVYCCLLRALEIIVDDL